MDYPIGSINLITGLGVFSWLIAVFVTALCIRISLLNVQLKKELEKAKKLIETDELTGLLNKRGLARELKQIDRQLKRGDTKEVGVCVIDLDYFKQVNDTYGHPAGDVILKFIADVFTEHTRATDVIARWMGDEFVILFLDAPVHAIESFMINIQTIFLSQKFSFSDHEVKIGLTYAITHTDSVTSSFEELFNEVLFKTADDICNLKKELPGGSRYKPPKS